MSATRFQALPAFPPKRVEERERESLTQAKNAKSTPREFQLGRKAEFQCNFPRLAPSSVFDDSGGHSACSEATNKGKESKDRTFEREGLRGRWSRVTSHSTAAWARLAGQLFNTLLPPRCLDRRPRSLVARVLAYLGWQLSRHATAQVCRAGLVPPRPCDTPGKCCGGTVRAAVPLWEVRTSEAQRSDVAACTLHRG